MITKTITLQIKVDEGVVQKKFPHFAELFGNAETFTKELMEALETDMHREGKAINHLAEEGYEVVIMDKKEGPWQQK